MTARVIAVDYARSQKLRAAIDQVMADRPKKQRDEFHYHAYVAVMLREAFWERYYADRVAQTEFAGDVAPAIRKLRTTRSTNSSKFEAIRERLYLDAREAGVPHGEASARAATLVAALDVVAAGASAIESACNTAIRKPQNRATPTDVLIRDLAHYFAQDFGRRPSASATGQFAQLLSKIVGGKAVGSDRLKRLIDACGITAKPARPGRKMRSNR